MNLVLLRTIGHVVRKESKLKPEIVFKTENIEDTMKITVQRELLLAGFSPLA